MAKRFIIRPTQWLVCPDDDRSTYGGRAYSVEIDSEGDGEFIVLNDIGAPQPGRFTLEPDAWPALKQAIDHAMTEIREHAREQEALL